MIKLYDEGVYLVNGREIVPKSEGQRVEAITGKPAGRLPGKMRGRGPWPIQF